MEITLVYIFGGYYFSTYLSHVLIKLISGRLLGLTSSPICFCLLLFWLCFCLSVSVCVSECLIIHAQPYIIYWDYLFLGYKFLLIICLCVRMWLNYTIISDSFCFFGGEFTEMNRGSCQGFGFFFIFFAGLAYSYICHGKGWVRDLDWILLALCCLVRLCRVKSSIVGSHVNPELGLGHPIM